MGGGLRPADDAHRLIHEKYLPAHEVGRRVALSGSASAIRRDMLTFRSHYGNVRAPQSGRSVRRARVNAERATGLGPATSGSGSTSALAAYRICAHFKRLAASQ